MNAKLVALVTLLAASGLALGQDIVLKATFEVEWCSHVYQTRFPVPLDINDDGILDIPTGSEYLRFIDPITMCEIPRAYQNSGFSNGNCYRCPIAIRRDGLAEYVFSYSIRDYLTDEQLVSNLIGNNFYVFDYDSDNIDDVIVISDSNQICQVYGIPTGNPPISPPQELDIQQVGEDFVITWDQVPTATAYRIEWSSALDGGVRFTRIGYTTGMTFTHSGQVGLERGFYRVLSEDNGTGVVRTIAQTPRGER